MNKNMVLRAVASLSLGAVLCLPALPALAMQTPQAAPSAESQKAGKRDAMRDAINSLNLTADQKSQVAGIFANAKSQREAIKADSTLSADQMHGKLKSLHEDTRAKLTQVLTPDQRAQLKANLQAARANAQAPAQQQ